MDQLYASSTSSIGTRIQSTPTPTPTPNTASPNQRVTAVPSSSSSSYHLLNQNPIRSLMTSANVSTSMSATATASASALLNRSMPTTASFSSYPSVATATELQRQPPLQPAASTTTTASTNHRAMIDAILKRSSQKHHEHENDTQRALVGMRRPVAQSNEGEGDDGDYDDLVGSKIKLSSTFGSVAGGGAHQNSSISSSSGAPPLPSSFLTAMSIMKGGVAAVAAAVAPLPPSSSSSTHAEGPLLSSSAALSLRRRSRQDTMPAIPEGPGLAAYLKQHLGAGGGDGVGDFGGGNAVQQQSEAPASTMPSAAPLAAPPTVSSVVVPPTVLPAASSGVVLRGAAPAQLHKPTQLSQVLTAPPPTTAIAAAASSSAVSSPFAIKPLNMAVVLNNHVPVDPSDIVIVNSARKRSGSRPPLTIDSAGAGPASASAASPMMAGSSRSMSLTHNGAANRKKRSPSKLLQMYAARRLQYSLANSTMNSTIGGGAVGGGGRGGSTEEEEHDIRAHPFTAVDSSPENNASGGHCAALALDATCLAMPSEEQQPAVPSASLFNFSSAGGGGDGDGPLSSDNRGGDTAVAVAAADSSDPPPLANLAGTTNSLAFSDDRGGGCPFSESPSPSFAGAGGRHFLESTTNFGQTVNMNAFSDSDSEEDYLKATQVRFERQASKRQARDMIDAARAAKVQRSAVAVSQNLFIQTNTKGGGGGGGNSSLPPSTVASPTFAHKRQQMAAPTAAAAPTTATAEDRDASPDAVHPAQVASSAAAAAAAAASNVSAPTPSPNAVPPQQQQQYPPPPINTNLAATASAELHWTRSSGADSHLSIPNIVISGEGNSPTFSSLHGASGAAGPNGGGVTLSGFGVGGLLNVGIGDASRGVSPNLSINTPHETSSTGRGEGEEEEEEKSPGIVLTLPEGFGEMEDSDDDDDEEEDDEEEDIPEYVLTSTGKKKKNPLLAKASKKLRLEQKRQRRQNKILLASGAGGGQNASATLAKLGISAVGVSAFDGDASLSGVGAGGGFSPLPPVPIVPPLQAFTELDRQAHIKECLRSYRHDAVKLKRLLLEAFAGVDTSTLKRMAAAGGGGGGRRATAVTDDTSNSNVSATETESDADGVGLEKRTRVDGDDNDNDEEDDEETRSNETAPSEDVKAGLLNDTAHRLDQLQQVGGISEKGQLRHMLQEEMAKMAAEKAEAEAAEAERLRALPAYLRNMNDGRPLSRKAFKALAAEQQQQQQQNNNNKKSAATVNATTMVMMNKSQHQSTSAGPTAAVAANASAHADPAANAVIIPAKDAASSRRKPPPQPLQPSAVVDTSDQQDALLLTLTIPQITLITPSPTMSREPSLLRSQSIPAERQAKAPTPLPDSIVKKLIADGHLAADGTSRLRPRGRANTAPADLSIATSVRSASTDASSSVVVADVGVAHNSSEEKEVRDGAVADSAVIDDVSAALAAIMNAEGADGKRPVLSRRAYKELKEKLVAEAVQKRTAAAAMLVSASAPAAKKREPPTATAAVVATQKRKKDGDADDQSRQHLVEAREKVFKEAFASPTTAAKAKDAKTSVPAAQAARPEPAAVAIIAVRTSPPARANNAAAPSQPSPQHQSPVAAAKKESAKGSSPSLLATDAAKSAQPPVPTPPPANNNKPTTAHASALLQLVPPLTNPHPREPSVETDPNVSVIPLSEEALAAHLHSLTMSPLGDSFGTAAAAAMMMSAASPSPRGDHNQQQQQPPPQQTLDRSASKVNLINQWIEEHEPRRREKEAAVAQRLQERRLRQQQRSPPHSRDGAAAIATATGAESPAKIVISKMSDVAVPHQPRRSEEEEGKKDEARPAAPSSAASAASPNLNAAAAAMMGREREPSPARGMPEDLLAKLTPNSPPLLLSDKGEKEATVAVKSAAEEEEEEAMETRKVAAQANADDIDFIPSTLNAPSQQQQQHQQQPGKPLNTALLSPSKLLTPSPSHQDTANNGHHQHESTVNRIRSFGNISNISGGSDLFREPPEADEACAVQRSHLMATAAVGGGGGATHADDDEDLAAGGGGGGGEYSPPAHTMQGHRTDYSALACDDDPHNATTSASEYHHTHHPHLVSVVGDHSRASHYHHQRSTIADYSSTTSVLLGGVPSLPNPLDGLFGGQQRRGTAAAAPHAAVPAPSAVAMFAAPLPQQTSSSSGAAMATVVDASAVLDTSAAEPFSRSDASGATPVRSPAPAPRRASLPEEEAAEEEAAGFGAYHHAAATARATAVSVKIPPPISPLCVRTGAGAGGGGDASSSVESTPLEPFARTPVMSPLKNEKGFEAKDEESDYDVAVGAADIHPAAESMTEKGNQRTIAVAVSRREAKEYSRAAEAEAEAAEEMAVSMCYDEGSWAPPASAPMELPLSPRGERGASVGSRTATSRPPMNTIHTTADLLGGSGEEEFAAAAAGGAPRHSVNVALFADRHDDEDEDGDDDDERSGLDAVNENDRDDDDGDGRVDVVVSSLTVGGMASRVPTTATEAHRYQTAPPPPPIAVNSHHNKQLSSPATPPTEEEATASFSSPVTATSILYPKALTDEEEAAEFERFKADFARPPSEPNPFDSMESQHVDNVARVDDGIAVMKGAAARAGGGGAANATVGSSMSAGALPPIGADATANHSSRRPSLASRPYSSPKAHHHSNRRRSISVASAASSQPSVASGWGDMNSAAMDGGASYPSAPGSRATSRGRGTSPDALQPLRPPLSSHHVGHQQLQQHGDAACVPSSSYQHPQSSAAASVVSSRNGITAAASSAGAANASLMGVGGLPPLSHNNTNSSQMNSSQLQQQQSATSFYHTRRLSEVDAASTANSAASFGALSAAARIAKQSEERRRAARVELEVTLGKAKLNATETSARSDVRRQCDAEWRNIRAEFDDAFDRIELRMMMARTGKQLW